MEVVCDVGTVENFDVDHNYGVGRIAVVREVPCIAGVGLMRLELLRVSVLRHVWCRIPKSSFLHC